MVSTMREVERKYELDADRALPDFRTLQGFSAQQQASAEELDAVYFDTADLRLAAAGITLRRRTGGADAGWHLKLPAGPDARDELRLPLDESAEELAAESVPEPLIDRVLLHTRGAELRPVAEISTNRARWLLSDTGGAPRAEFVLDTVSAQAHDQPGTAWREIEVELLTDDRGPLDQVDDWLTGQGIHRSPAASKLARVLGDQVPAPRTAPDAPAALGPDSPAVDVVHAYLRGQVDRLRQFDPEVRVDAPDAVHQMRVTTRRLRSALRTYRKLLDAERANALRVELAWLAAALGGPRDAEVLAERFGGEVAALDPDLVVGPVRERILQHFADAHTAAFREMLAELHTPRYFALLDELDDFVDHPQRNKKVRRPASTALPVAVSRAYQKLDAAVAEIDRATTSADRDLAIHESRKCAKAARYAAELATTALGKDAARFAKQMKLLQERLGEHQDSVVARQEIRRLATALSGGEIDGFTFGILYGQQLTRASVVEGELPEVWRQVSDPKYRRWMN